MYVNGNCGRKMTKNYVVYDMKRQSVSEEDADDRSQIVEREGEGEEDYFL